MRALGPTPIRAIFARAIVILATLGLTGYALFEMLSIVEFSKMTVLQGVMIFFFTVTFALDRVLRRLGHRRPAGARSTFPRHRRIWPARAPRC